MSRYNPNDRVGSCSTRSLIDDARTTVPSQTRHPSAQLRVGRRARNVHAAALTSWRLPNHGHVRGLHALTALLRLVLDLLALVEVAEAAAGDVREVHEDLAAAV